jgi:hypothetical protein
MSPSSQFIFLSILLWCAAAWMFGTIGWLAFKYRKHINPTTVQAAMRGEKKEADPEVARKWAEEVKRFRRVGFAIWLTFILLAIGLSIYNTANRR